MTHSSGYFRHPTIHGDQVVFVSEDDLWTVSAEGGVARRLTAAAGRVTFPALSPDGTRIAFTGQDDGPAEIYVMDALGGAATRMTWLGGMTQTAGWMPNGKSILFASDWRRFQPNYAHLHTVPAAGGPPKLLPYGPARAVAFEPKGKGVVIGRNSGDPARWKRYRGGTAGTLWVDRSGKGSFSPLLKLVGNLASPMWVGARIYFLSDHEGHGNLYSCTPTGRGLRRHTRHEDYYVRFPSTDGKRIVYHAGADLYVFDPRSNETTRIDVEMHSPRAQRARTFAPAPRYLEDFDLHPEGHSVAASVRGGAYAMGLFEGVPARFGKPSSERHRHASWLPDGKTLLTVSDAKGDECLVLHPTKGRGRAKTVKGDFGRVLDLAVAPAGTPRVALTNHRQELLLVDLTARRSRIVDRAPGDRIDGLAWSPDGRYLAYGLPQTPTSSNLKILDTTTGKVRDVTRPDFRDGMPAFDPEGKYLYFISGRVFDPVYDGLYFDLGFPKGSRPYLIPLRKDTPSPFDGAQRAPRAPQGAPGGAGKGGGDTPPKVVIDFGGIEDRVVAFPVPEGRYLAIAGAKGRALFLSVPPEGSLDQPWPAPPEPPAKATLEAWDFEKGKRETVVPAVSSFRLSMKGGVLGVRMGNRLRALSAGVTADGLPKATQAGRESGWLDLGRLAVEVDPPAEWKQMFAEAWRLQRDQFWTPDMSGVDWKRVYARYLPLVDRVSTRSEFSDLVWEMQGELGTSHCYEFGGDYRPTPAWHQGFLGADLEFRKKTGAWRVVRIPHGDSWDAKSASPLAAPGVQVRAGDEIVAVEGEAVGPDRSPYQCLVHRAGKPVTLDVRGSNGKVRRVAVTTLRTEMPLRYRDWVEANRAQVHKRTKGRVGYLHIPDMGPRGFSEFHRYYLTEVERDGLIVDVRFNGGGHVSQLLLQKLLRKRIGYDKNRWQVPISYPMHAPFGPMVALTNEYAGSDGDMFSHAFKLNGLGPLIGKRTWGGVVGIWPRHALVDGSVTSQPEFSHCFADVGWGLENYGTDPDIEVEIRPQDHAAGKDPQLERAIAEIGGVLKRAKVLKPEFPKRPVLAPPSLPRDG